MARPAKPKSIKRPRDYSPSPSTRSPKRQRRRGRGRPPKRVDPSTAPDKFFPARAILDEDTFARKYLVDWEGLDPTTGEPFEPTWEHYEFCTEDLINEWEQQQYQAEHLHSGTDSDQESLSAPSSQGPIPFKRNRINRLSSSPPLSEPPDVIPVGRSPVVIPSPLTTSQLLEYQYISSQELSALCVPESSQLNGSGKSIGHQSQAGDVFHSTCGTQASSTVWETPARPRRFNTTAFVSDSQSWGVPSDHIPSTQPSLGDVGTADRRTASGSQLSCLFAAADSGHSLQHCLLNPSAVIPETQLLATTQESNALVSSGSKAAPSPDLPSTQKYTQDFAGRQSNTEEASAAPRGISAVGRHSGNDQRQLQRDTISSSHTFGLVSPLVNSVQGQRHNERSTTPVVFPDVNVEDSIEEHILVSSPKFDSTGTQSQPHLSLGFQNEGWCQITGASQREFGGTFTQRPTYAQERSSATKDCQSGQVNHQTHQTPTLSNINKSDKLRGIGRSRASSCATASQKPEGTPRPNPSVTNLTQSSELETRFSTFEPEVDLNDPRPSLIAPSVLELPGTFPSILYDPTPPLQQSRLDSETYATSLPHSGAQASPSTIALIDSILPEASLSSSPRRSQYLSGVQSHQVIAENSTSQRDPIPTTILRRARSLTGSSNPRNESSVLSSGLELIRRRTLNGFGDRPSQSRLSTNEPASYSAIMSYSPSHPSAHEGQDIPDSRVIDTTQSESTHQHDSTGDTDMLDVQGAMPTGDEGREDGDLEALVATPYTARGEYLVGLSMEGVQGNQYRTTMNFESKKIVAFTEGDSQEAEPMAKEAEELLTDVRNILTHVDLHFRSADALTQHENSDTEAAEWSKNAAAKFRFLGHLFERLRWEQRHIVLISRPGEIQKIVETFVRGSKIQYAADNGGDDDLAGFKIQADWPHGKLLVTILNSESDVSEHDSADLMISLDPTLDLDTDPILRIREAMNSPLLLPVITPIITNSLEHIDRCIPPTIKGFRRMQLLVRFMAELRNRAGRVDEGSMVDRAAEAVAQALVAEEATDEEGRKGFDVLTTVGSVADLVNTQGGSISPLSISSVNPQSTSETPGPSKRQLEDGDEGPAKRMKTDETKSNTKSKHQSLREDLAYTKHRLEEFERALEECQATNEDQKDVILGLRQELSDNKAEVAKASERIEKQTDIISKLKEDKVTLEESLAEARTALETSAIPEIAQQDRVRRERDEALKSVEKLKRAQENQSREMDFIREQYQSASSSAAECSAEKNSLTQRVRDLERMVASEVERAKKLSLSSANQAWRDEVDKLQAQLRDRDDMIRRQSEELKTMRPRQGVGTRAGSVPRSPRIVGGGPGSRGGSPAPSGLGGRVERLRNLNA
ncbi:class II histone deacetylase complex subunits 2 and 3-domain-containing protein [Phyllosticta citrichinensis]|uniref:Class II histone deacetylase complex subunits 2 and 3-domain-containing protein n=1 Tax=Phyllosticta citrichinensis TaxID=1130410 RepID=A0ABR1XZ65_9PEZI